MQIEETQNEILEKSEILNVKGDDDSKIDDSEEKENKNN